MRAMKRSLTATAVAVLVGVAACDTSPTALTGNDAPDALAAALVGGLPAGSNFEHTVSAMSTLLGELSQIIGLEIVRNVNRSSDP